MLPSSVPLRLTVNAGAFCSTVVIGFAADPSAVGSQDATGLVSFVSSVSGLSDIVSTPLFVRGTVAFSAPANSTQCSVSGLINLEVLELAF